MCCKTIVTSEITIDFINFAAKLFCNVFAGNCCYFLFITFG